MGWLERRLGTYAIPRLLYGIFIGQSLVFLMGYTRPDILQNFILYPDAVLAGEWWRLLTFAFFPPFSSSMLNLILFIFIMMFFFMIAGGLEQAWGAFRLNLYVAIGLLGHIGAAFLLGIPVTSEYLQMTLFLAFAMFYPDTVIYAFLILPVKIKWLAWIDAAYMMFALITGTATVRVMILISCANFLLFFGPQLVQQAFLAQRSMRRRAAFDKSIRDTIESMPAKRCTQCGRSDADADIRLCTCTRCGPEGSFWCYTHVQEHLKKHAE